MIIVSRCLLGHKCRYDGGSKPNREVIKLLEADDFVEICPECLGGLEIPRPPAEISEGDGEDVLNGHARVKDLRGRDVTEQFLQGAYAALEMAKSAGARTALLKSKSPSCGAGEIYDGSFTGTLREGDGVTAALLKREGIEVKPV